MREEMSAGRLVLDVVGYSACISAMREGLAVGTGLGIAAKMTADRLELDVVSYCASLCAMREGLGVGAGLGIAARNVR